jgi:hypothetical protein
VQLRVELSQETTTASNSNVELTEVRIIWHPKNFKN